MSTVGQCVVYVCVRKKISSIVCFARSEAVFSISFVFSLIFIFATLQQRPSMWILKKNLLNTVESRPATILCDNHRKKIDDDELIITMPPNFVIYFAFLLAFIVHLVKSDVYGCNSFIKSHAGIDFSKVEVNLLMKSGVCKDRVEPIH